MITTDWRANLTPSANKNDFVYKCVQEPGVHWKVNNHRNCSIHPEYFSDKKLSHMSMPKVIIKCVPGKGCQKHQRHFQAHSTSLLFRMFCKGNAALAPIVTEYIYRKMRPFFTAKPTLRWEVTNLTDVLHQRRYISLQVLLKTCIVIFLCPISVKFQDTYFSDGNINHISSSSNSFCALNFCMPDFGQISGYIF